jgi:hypothetical protein
MAVTPAFPAQIQMQRGGRLRERWLEFFYILSMGVNLAIVTAAATPPCDSFELQLDVVGGGGTTASPMRFQ